MLKSAVCGLPRGRGSAAFCRGREGERKARQVGLVPLGRNQTEWGDSGGWHTGQSIIICNVNNRSSLDGNLSCVVYGTGRVRAFGPW